MITTEQDPKLLKAVELLEQSGQLDWQAHSDGSERATGIFVKSPKDREATANTKGTDDGK